MLAIPDFQTPYYQHEQTLITFAALATVADGCEVDATSGIRQERSAARALETLTNQFSARLLLLRLHGQ
jgi:hypothetical protein